MRPRAEIPEVGTMFGWWRFDKVVDYAPKGAAHGMFACTRCNRCRCILRLSNVRNGLTSKCKRCDRVGASQRFYPDHGIVPRLA